MSDSTLPDEIGALLELDRLRYEATLDAERIAGLQDENARLRVELGARGYDPYAVDAREAFVRMTIRASKMERERAEDRSLVYALMESIPRCVCGDVADEHNRHDGWVCDKCSTWPRGVLLHCAPVIRKLLARVETWRST